MSIMEFFRSGGLLRFAKYLVEKVLGCVPRRHPKLAPVRSKGKSGCVWKPAASRW